MSTQTTATAIDVSAEREVAAGIAWFNLNLPNWFEHISERKVRKSGLLSTLRDLTDRSPNADMVRYREMGLFTPFRLGSAAMHREVLDWYANAESLWRLEITRRQQAAAAGEEGGQ